jgi:hypothetical protein
MGIINANERHVEEEVIVSVLISKALNIIEMGFQMIEIIN